MNVFFIGDSVFSVIVVAEWSLVILFTCIVYCSRISLESVIAIGSNNDCLVLQERVGVVIRLDSPSDTRKSRTDFDNGRRKSTFKSPNTITWLVSSRVELIEFSNRFQNRCPLPGGRN